MRLWAAVAVLAAASFLAGCGSTHATVKTSRGEHLMLLGFDPVAYFTQATPARGKHTLPATTGGRTYYFAADENRRAFLANPAR